MSRTSMFLNLNTNVLTKLFCTIVVVHTVIKYIVFWGWSSLNPSTLHVSTIFLSWYLWKSCVVAELLFLSSTAAATLAVFLLWVSIVAALRCHLVLGMSFVMFLELVISQSITGWQPAVLRHKGNVLLGKYSNFLLYPNLPFSHTWVFFIQWLNGRHCVLSLLKLVLTAQ